MADKMNTNDNLTLYLPNSLVTCWEEHPTDEAWHG